jgi:putative spermidine/putrescine transport system permease protein
VRAEDGRSDPELALGLSVRALTVAAALLLVVPHLIVVVTSFDPSPAGTFPPHGLTGKWYANALARPAFREAFGLSLTVAALTAVGALTAGVMAAVLLVRHRFPGREVLGTLLQSPMMIPEVVLGLGFLIVFSRWRFHVSTVNLVLAHVVITLPYAVRVVSANLYSVGPSIEEAARVLGAGPLRTFFSITMPVIKQGMLTAAIFAFVVSFDNFTLSAFLVSARGTLPVEIYSYIRTGSDPTIAAVSALLIGISVALVLAVERIVGFEGLVQSGRMRG